MPLFGEPNIEKLKAKKNIDGLTRALTYKRNLKIALEAARALGEIGGSEAVEPLSAILNQSDIELRTAGIKALGQIDDSRIQGILLKQLQVEDEDVCHTAVQALDKIGWQPVGTAEKVAEYIKQSNFTKLSSLNQETIKEVLLIHLFREIDWRIKAKIAIHLVGSGLSKSDPRLQAIKNTLIEWSHKKDRKTKILIAGERNDHMEERIVETYERERALAKRYLQQL